MKPEEQIIIVPDEETDALAYGLRHIEAHVDKGGWDQRPMFYAIEQVVLAEELDIAQLSFKTIPMPYQVFDDASTHLPELTAALEVHDTHWGEDPMLDQMTIDIHKGFLTPSFIGVAMIFEGWSIQSGGDVTQEEAMQVSRNRMVHLHPNRVESRTAIALISDGTAASLIRIRGEEPEAQRFDELQGRIPSALGDLCMHFIFMRNKLIELHLI